MSTEPYLSNYENNEEPQPLETSVFFEPYAIYVLLFLLLVAIWYRFMPLIVVNTFLLLLYTIINVWRKLSLLKVKPVLALTKSRLFVDEEFLINATVYNDKWLPLIWLEWSFPKIEAVRLGDTEENTYTIRLLWLLWFQKVEWTITGRALQRGVYNLGKVTLRSGDGFRFSEIEKVHNLMGKIYIYPRLVPVKAPLLRPTLQYGVKGKQGGFMEDPLLVIGVRDYQPGDDLRKFNWRAMARTGKLQTNVYQPVVIRQLFIYIDIRGFIINEGAYEDPQEQIKYVAKKRKEFEEFLSIIASLVVKYGEQGISMGFATNGQDYQGRKMISILPCSNLTPILDQLAKITQRLGVRSTVVLDEIIHKGRMSSPLFVFCEQVTEDHYHWFQQHKHKLSQVCFYYKKQSEYAQKLFTVSKSLDTLF